MLHSKSRFEHNEYFHFDPLFSALSLIFVFVFMGLLAYVLSWIR